MSVIDRLAPYWKALLGFVAPGAVVIGSAVLESSDGGATITAAEWVTAAVSMIVTGATVYAVPNRDPAGTHQDESVQPPGAHDDGPDGVVRYPGEPHA